MRKRVSFSGSQGDEVFSFVFCDDDGNRYLLCEEKHSVDGMNPFVYDQIANLKNVQVETKIIDGKEYITKIFVSKKDFK